MPSKRYNSFIICTSPRSGSTLLCKLLAATGVSGNPDSHFHNPSIPGWLAAYQLSKSDYESNYVALSAIFDAAHKRGKGDTEIFGLRLQRGSFDFFIEQAGILNPTCEDDKERIQTAFGSTLFIYLTRQKNWIRQYLC